jgi:hypothetical protein
MWADRDMEEHSVFDHKPRENGIHSQYALPHLQHNIGDRIYSSGGHPNDIYPNGGHPNDIYPNGGHPNDIYPNGGHPNDIYPNGIHPMEERIYPNGGRIVSPLRNGSESHYSSLPPIDDDENEELDDDGSDDTRGHQVI